MTEQQQSDQTNSREVIRRALSRELANVEDNLYRFRLDETANPGRVTGNGQPFTEVIESLERQRDDTRRALAAMEANDQ